jgi:signal transduction histidine kinase
LGFETLPAPVDEVVPASAGNATEVPSLLALRLLPLLCVLLPLVAYVSVGSYRYGQIHAETGVRLDRALRIAAEHASKVLDTSESLLARVEDAAAGATPEQLTRNGAAMHQQLRTMAGNKRQLQGIWIFGPDGRPRASSRFYPAPLVDESDRDFFLWHKNERGGLHVSRMHVARTTGEPHFDISTTRRNADGGFAGVVSVRLLVDYFRRFHEDLSADEPGLAITMLRDDGAIFSRWPPIENAVSTLSPNSPVMSKIRAGIHSGTATGVSSVDGRERLLAFQKVGEYPVYLGTGMDVAEMRRRWIQEMLWLAAFGLPPMLALFLVARVALRRSRESVATAMRLQQETEARRRVEEALLQSQKLEALGRLTGGVAHDFNNALMVISTNLELMMAKHSAVVGRYAESMSRAIGSATKLTRQLLAFSRRQALVPEHMLLQERLPPVRELLSPLLGNQVRLEVSVAPDTLPIRVDSAEFELALINLAVNARDALPRDGSFRVRAYNARGNLPPLLEGSMVVVEAADNGAGVPAEVIGKVFEPFFTTKPVGEGTGLGLSQVYGLCQRAGGTATIESEKGQGTTVRMYFPPDLQGPSADQPRPHAPRRDIGKHVLMVEDNEEVAGALKPLLETLGCTVTAVTRAAEGRDWLASQSRLPDVLLTDVVMPGEMDGVALAQLVRGRWPAVRVIVMTGYAEQIDSVARLGFEILPKPCSLEMLAEAIERATR